MKKRNHLLLLLFLVCPLISWAQNSVPATEIITKINRGETVSLKNTTITGDLDLTQLRNKTFQEPKGKKGDNETKVYVSRVTVPVSFENCTFTGNVFAYLNPDDKNRNGQIDEEEQNSQTNELHKADFEKDVRFEKCVFEKLSAFKYSTFDGLASFAGSTFAQEALFKYSVFTSKSDFTNSKFKEMANFKYVNFPVQVSFAGATFEEVANFKYAGFSEGADFQKAVFNGLANFKYSKLSDPMQWKGAVFNGTQDLKYASLNNSSFNSSALKEKTK